MKLKHLLASVLGLALLSPSAAMAGSDMDIDEGPNVLVVKIPVKKDVTQGSQQLGDQGDLGDKGDQGDQDLGDISGMDLEGAYLIALKTELPIDESGAVDFEKLATSCDELEPDAVHHDFKVVTQLADDDIPEDVLSELQRIEDSSDLEVRLNWRIWTPYGSIGNRGIYGYGYRGHYGYGRYNPWYSRYNYYNGYRHYRFYPSRYNRRYGGYYHYYYWR